MTEFKSQISLMARESDLCRFWGKTYGLISEQCKTLFLGDIIDLNGFSNLHAEIEHNVIEYRCDLLFLDMSAPIVNPFKLFDLKSKYQFTLVALAIDDEMKFTQVSSTLASLADLVITSDYVSVNRYRQSGVNAHFLPLPVYIPQDLPSEKKNFKYDVSFLGRRAPDKPTREAYLNILEQRTDVEILGNQGSQTENFLSTEKMYSLFRDSAINLNFTGITVDHISDNPLFDRCRGMKLRPFEVYAAGGVCISEYAISLGECFEDGKDIIFFYNSQDMLEKIDYFLNNKDEARVIANAGRSKVIKYYSSEATANNLKSLLQSSIKQKGADLFGFPIKLTVSNYYIKSFIETLLGKCIEFFFEGRFKVALADLRYLLIFLNYSLKNIGLSATARAIALGSYRAIKTGVSKLKNRLTRKS